MTLNEEHAFAQSRGFWFQLSKEDKQKAKSPFGPANPQALNRYAYTLNNPLRYVDPTGHFVAVAALVALGVVAEIAVAIVAVLAVATILWCVSDPGCRSWVMEQVRNGVESAQKFAGGITTHHEARWVERDTDFGRIKVRKLNNDEVDADLHQGKQKGGYKGRDSYWEDEDGNIYIGGDNGELRQVS